MTDVYKIVKGYHEKFIYFSENIHNIKNFQIMANEDKNAVRYIQVGNYMLWNFLFLGKFSRRI